MKGFSIFLILLSLIFSTSNADLVKLFNHIKDNSSPVFRILFDYKKSHADMIDHFKALMKKMAPFAPIESNTLSEVIFSYITFNPFSRREGTEISQDFFAKAVRSFILELKNTKHENELIFLQEQILLMINGVIKSSCKFDLKVLSDIFAEISEEANNIDPSDDFRKAIFDDLVKYSNHIVNTQAKTYKEVKELDTTLLLRFESLVANLIFSLYQPNFKESYLEAFQLRTLEVYNALIMLYHYKKLDKDKISSRLHDIYNLVVTSTRSFDGLEFSEIGKNDADSFNQRVNLLIETQNQILKLTKPETSNQMKYNLKALRVIVRKQELERKKNDLI